MAGAQAAYGHHGHHVPSYGYADHNRHSAADGYPYPPAPAQLPQAHAYGPDNTLHVQEAEGINWGPSLTPFNAPKSPSGTPDPHFDEYFQSQGGPLKVRRLLPLPMYNPLINFSRSPISDSSPLGTRQSTWFCTVNYTLFLG